MKNFSNYFKILEKIKNQGNIDFIRMDHNDHKIILKLIDDSDEEGEELVKYKTMKKMDYLTQLAREKPEYMEKNIAYVCIIF